MATKVNPFQISVPDEDIQRMKKKLELSTFPGEVEFSDDWNFGAPLGDIKRLAKYWLEGFDWRANEAKLNKLPHFKTTVDVDGFGPLGLHFIHQRSSREDAIPLLFSHGWPGNFLEVTKILPLLTEPSSDGPAFHVVAPSLPNYGFSEGPKKKGFSIPQYAESLHKIMLNLGYDKLGGDWGYFITRMIGILYPDHCLATHINFFVTAGPPMFSKFPIASIQHAVQPYTELEKKGLARSAWFRKEGNGYFHEQSTRPSTIGFALRDSPVALLAWVYEKLHDWTDNYQWTDDEILTWISIYQFSTAGPQASVRTYYENMHSEREKVAKIMQYSPVPLGLSLFPQDVIVLPKIWAQSLGPIVFESVHARGGHFAAYECPEELAGDVRKMFGKEGGGHQVARQLGAKL